MAKKKKSGFIKSVSYKPGDVVCVEDKPTRQVILEQGIDLTTNDRNKTYGDPTVNMQHMAGLLTAYFSNLICSTDGNPIYTFTGEDAAIIMSLAKLSRTANRSAAYHQDNYTDASVYSAMAGECAEKERP